MGLDLPVPDHSTVYRRVRKLNITIAVRPRTEGMHLVVDSLLSQSLRALGNGKPGFMVVT